MFGMSRKLSFLSILVIVIGIILVKIVLITEQYFEHNAQSIELVSLTSKLQEAKIEVQIAAELKKKEQLAISIRALPTFARIKMTFVITSLIILCISFIILVIVLAHRSLVHYAEIDGNRIPVMLFQGSKVVDVLARRQLIAPYQRVIGIITDRGVSQSSQLGLPEAPSIITSHVSIPTLKDIIAKGDLERDRILLGFNSDRPCYFGWPELMTIGIGGGSGSGKTNTMSNIITQSLLTEQVCTFYIIDDHYPHSESLLSKLGQARYSKHVKFPESTFNTHELIKEVRESLARRLKGKEESYPAKVLCIDETLKVCRTLPEAMKTVFMIATEGRKVGIYGIFSATNWKAALVGGSEVRDSLACRLAHRMRKKQANLFLEDTEYARQITSCNRGECLFFPQFGDPQILQVPYSGDTHEYLSKQDFVNEDISKDEAMQNVTPEHSKTHLNEYTGSSEKANPVTTFIRSLLSQGIARTEICEIAEIHKSTLSRVLSSQQTLSQDAVLRLQSHFMVEDG